MRWSLSFSALSFVAVGSAWAQPQTQPVSGRVVDHAGGPVANSRIRAVPLTAAASGAVATPAGRGANALGAPDGSFALTGTSGKALSGGAAVDVSMLPAGQAPFATR